MLRFVKLVFFHCRSPRLSKGVTNNLDVTPLLTRGLLHKNYESWSILVHLVRIGPKLQGNRGSFGILFSIFCLAASI